MPLPDPLPLIDVLKELTVEIRILRRAIEPLSSIRDLLIGEAAASHPYRIDLDRLARIPESRHKGRDAPDHIGHHPDHRVGTYDSVLVDRRS